MIAGLPSLEGRPAVVVGLARSGLAAARFLSQRGLRVVATDLKPRSALPAEALALEGPAVRLEVGGHRRQTFVEAGLIVVSPGVPWELPDLEAARAAGVPVLAELDLARRVLTGRVIAVTGTKGKSTTTAAIGAFLREAAADDRVGGNIGQPAIGLVEGASSETIFVLEVSSFQLEGTEALRPDIAVFLNLSDDHLDRHATFEVYAAAKARVFRGQTATSWAVVAGDDARVLDLASATPARLVTFAADAPASGDAAYFRDGSACLRRGGREEALFARAAVQLPGEHLALDLLVAAAAARLAGAPAEALRAAVARFRGAEHTLELVVEDERGVRFYNDSKATNIAAASKSLEAFDRPVIAIMGGRFKGGDLASLARVAAARARLVLLIGEARPLFAEAFRGLVAFEECASLEAAVARAQAVAQRGDVIVLAPACASFDMFEDYAQRGRAFKEAVRRQLAAPRGEVA